MIHMLSPTLPSGWSMHSCYFILPSDLIGWIYRILDSYLNLPLIGYYLFVVLTPRCWQWQARLTKLSFTHLARRMALVKLPALRFPSSMKCPLTRMRTLPILTFLSGHLWGKVYCGATETRPKGLGCEYCLHLLFNLVKPIMWSFRNYSWNWKSSFTFVQTIIKSFTLLEQSHT